MPRIPTGATFLTKATVTPVGADEWADVDAVVYFWVRRPETETGLDGRLLAALRAWFTGQWKFATTVYAASEPLTQQVNLLKQTDLTVRFELTEPSKTSMYLLFG